MLAKNMKTLRFILIALCLASTSLAQSRFARVDLPLQVSVEVPLNWWLLSGDINTTIEAAGEAATKLAGIDLSVGKKVNLFRANSMPRSTYASIAVNATDSDIPPDLIKSATKAELKEIEEMMAEMIRRVLAVQNLQFLKSLGLERMIISGHVTIVFRYRRSSPNGPVVVSLNRLFLGAKEISFNLSYREAEGALWKPIIEYITQSIKVGKNG
jgi:hypothetical protein